MELNAKVVVVLPSVSGISASGNAWKKQDLIVETLEQHAKKICVEVWGDDTRLSETLKPGNHVNVKFNVESREYDGRWYTSVRSWKLTVTGV